jgi:hypothetical protein
MMVPSQWSLVLLLLTLGLCTLHAHADVPPAVLAGAPLTTQSDGHAIHVTEALLRNEAQATVPNALAERVHTFWKDYSTADAAAASMPPLTSSLSRLFSDLYTISNSPAPINYCEYDYVVTPLIAEFWNTISNIGFIAVGVYGLVVSIRMGLRPRWYYLSFLILMTGLCSALYHATLTSVAC